MSKTYVIVGAGPVGRHTAEVLRARGDEVRLVTRSGRVRLDGVESVAADASDPEALTRLSEGAAALFNCANPVDYTTWEQIWPPLAESLLTAAERSGATLVTASCLYPYGPTDTPMVEGQPDAATDHKGRLRAGMWAEARSRHEGDGCAPSRSVVPTTWVPVSAATGTSPGTCRRRRRARPPG